MTSYYTDFYGRTRGGQDSASPVDIPMPYQVASSSSTDASTGIKTVVRYTRFQGGSNRVALWRETTEFDGTTNDIISYTHEFALAKWDDRESEDTVWVPINECWDYKTKVLGL